MPALVIKNLPAELHKRLKQQAQKSHRSMTKEAIYLLDAGLSGGQGVPIAREIPQPYQGKKPLTDKLLHKWKRQGMA